MAGSYSICFLIVMTLFFSVDAYTFFIGEEDGWTPNTCWSYETWAKSHRFRLNDELVFKYEKGHDSVLVVTGDDYARCNRDNPMRIMRSGDSKYKLMVLGKIYFISGHDENCEKGQRFAVDVMPVAASPIGCNNSSPPSPSPSPVGIETLPPVHAPSPSRSAPVHAPSPLRAGPVQAPSPLRAGPVHAPSPLRAAPAHAPSSADVGVAPVQAPSPSHAGRAAPVHAPSPSPGTTMKPPPTVCPHDPPHPPQATSPAVAKQNPHSPSPAPATLIATHNPPVQAPSPTTKETPTPPCVSSDSQAKAPATSGKSPPSASPYRI